MLNLHWQYLKRVLKHKWYVLLECRKLGLPLWVGIIHDWQKFSPVEWNAYIDYFLRHSGKDKPQTVKEAFDRAWHHHQMNGPHHWQYWLLVYDNEDEIVTIKMPDRYVREMLADWRGAGMAYTGKDDTKAWYIIRRERMKKVLHPETRAWIEQQLGIEP